MLGCSVAAFRRATSNFYSGLFDSLYSNIRCEKTMCVKLPVYFCLHHTVLLMSVFLVIMPATVIISLFWLSNTRFKLIKTQIYPFHFVTLVSASITFAFYMLTQYFIFVVWQRLLWNKILRTRTKRCKSLQWPLGSISVIFTGCFNYILVLATRICFTFDANLLVQNNCKPKWCLYVRHDKKNHPKS